MNTKQWREYQRWLRDVNRICPAMSAEHHTALSAWWNSYQRLQSQGIHCGADYYRSFAVFRARIWKPRRKPKAERPQCGAQCRDGHQCRARVTLDRHGRPRKRCRLHGGLSTGPRSAAGRAAIAQSNRRRAECKRV
jgi:hypothetical protein